MGREAWKLAVLIAAGVAPLAFGLASVETPFWLMMGICWAYGWLIGILMGQRR